MRYEYRADPSPHLYISELLPERGYERLRFPDELIDPDAEWGITSSDPAYERVLTDPGWRALHDRLRGAPFVHEVLDAFADDLPREECLVEPGRARLTAFTETRSDKQREMLAEGADPNELYTRLDFQSKREGAYREFVHLDWARRIVGGILFFSDAEAEGLRGGELGLYRDRAFRNDRWCHEPELVVKYPPRHNTGVIFLNSNSGFHGPCRITALSGRRRWLYYTISSKAEVWPCAARADREAGVEAA
ncbi:MAG: hypothetical protein QOI10_2608 [Solirubrobacterales bacterium]|jgi:hypothetical protein|nr:hypothetical protein [Solirubrobacterales bacterium]